MTTRLYPRVNWNWCSSYRRPSCPNHCSVAALIAAGGLLSLLPCIARPEGTSPLSASGAPSSLVVTQDPGVECIAPSIDVYHFGAISTLQADHVEHTFTVSNESNAPQVLTSVVPSCGCTSALISGASGNLQIPVAIAPGAKIAIRVSTSLQYLPFGEVNKWVTLLIKDHPEETTTLRLSGALAPPVRFEPTSIDFGTSPAGTERSRILTVSMSPQLMTARERPQIVSSNPYVTVVPIIDTAANVAQMRAVALQSSSSQSTPLITQTYKVTLSKNAPEGVLDSEIAWIIPAPAVATVELSAHPSAESVPHDAAASPSVVPIPIQGQVTGGMSAFPAMAVLQRSKDAPAPKQQLTLTAEQSGALDDLTVAPESSDIAASLTTDDGKALPTLRLQNAESAGNRRSYKRLLLNISLAHSSFIGSLHTHLIVSNARGEQLVIPVDVTSVSQ